VARLKYPIRTMPAGAEFGYESVQDAIRTLGSRHFFDIVRTQTGIPTPPTPAAYGYGEYGLADYGVVMDFHRFTEVKP